MIPSLSSSPSYDGIAPLDVVQFYSGKTLLITGCTGFVGKVVLEKVLRCLPQVRRVYVLIRPRKEQQQQEKGTSSHDAIYGSGSSSSVGAYDAPAEGVFAQYMRSAEQRMRREIIDSEIFTRLRADIGKDRFERLVSEKVVAVPGDVMSRASPVGVSARRSAEDHLFHESSPNTMISAEMARRLMDEVQVVIHVAASIAFQERIDNALRLNTLGTLRVMQFAKLCRRIEVMCHVSTSYVNCNRRNGSFVEERIYPMGFPGGERIIDFCDRILRLDSEQELERATAKYLAMHKYPNTYTFTKSLAEHLLLEMRGDRLPIAIIRPSIIGAALREPMPGWIDTLSASASMIFMVGMGIVNTTPAKGNVISDQIPVDFVANAIITAAAHVSTTNQQLRISSPSLPPRTLLEQAPVFKIFMCGTSAKNHTTWDDTAKTLLIYWQSHTPKKAIAKPNFNWSPNSLVYNARFFVSYTAPKQLYRAMGTMLRNRSYLKTSRILGKMEERTHTLNEHFRFFTNYEWIFDAANLDDVADRLRAHSPEQCRTFFLDVSEIDWKMYVQYFCYGIQKYIMKEEPNLPTKTDITREESADWFADIAWAYGSEGKGQFFGNLTREEMMESVLRSRSVQHAIENEAVDRSMTFVDVENRAREIMDRMFASPRMGTVRALAWMFRKVWRILYQSVVIDAAEVDHVRRLTTPGTTESNRSGPLVIIPTHRSYIDFLVMQYIAFAYGLPVPHIAAGEDFLNMFIVRDLFRHAGAFFLRRQFGSDELYKSIFAEYVHQILQVGSPLEFFVEGTRSRGGKTLHPKFGLLNIIADSFLDQRVHNLTILPIHIAYEKLIESEAYANELLGAKKKPESLANLFRSLDILRNKYGEIDVKMAQEISLRDYTEKLTEKYSTPERTFDPYNNTQDKRLLVRDLGFKITYELNRASVCMPSALVSTVLLAYRSGGLTMENLIRKIGWLKDEVVMRNGRLHWNVKDNHDGTVELVQHALKLMDKLIVTKTKDAMVMVMPNVRGRQDYKHIIQLTVYRNSIIFLFAQEAIMCCALESFRVHGRTMDGTPLTTNSHGQKVIQRCDLLSETAFLSELLKLEFIYRENPNEPEDYNGTLDLMILRGIVQTSPDSDQEIVVSETDGQDPQEHDMRFLLCSLIWPFVDSYWATMLAFITSPPITSITKDSDISNIDKPEDSIPRDTRQRSMSGGRSRSGSSSSTSSNNSVSNSVTIAGPKSFEPSSVPEGTMLQKIQWLVDRLFVESKVEFYESCSMDTIKNAVQTLVEMGIVGKSKREVVDKKGVASVETFLGLACPYKRALDTCLHIARFKRQSAQHVVFTTDRLMSPFPIISKL